MGATSLFLQLDHDRFRATELSRGPWDPGALHGGPPAALVAGAMDEAIATFARDELTTDDEQGPIGRATQSLLVEGR